MIEQPDANRRRVLTVEDIQDLSEIHRLGEVRCSGWWAYDRAITGRLIV